MESNCTGHTSWSHDTFYLVHALQLRANAAMHAEDLLIYNGGYWEAIEAISESFPQFYIIASFACKMQKNKQKSHKHLECQKK